MGSLRPSVDNLQSLGNFTQMFRWSISFEKLPKGVSVNSDAINFRAESMTIPKKQGTSVEVMIRGNKVRQPGIAEYNSPLTLTLFETVDNTVTKFLYDWNELCWETKNGSSGIISDFADLHAIMLLTRLNNKDQPIWTYKIIGAYLEGAEWGDLDAQTADPIKPQLSLAYQRYEDIPK